MYRTTSVLALGLFLGFAPIGALAQTQTDDADTQQLTQPSDSQQSTDTMESDDQQSTDTMESDDQQSTETETLETDDQETTETETLETDEQETTETETLETDEQETTETETLETDEQETTETDTMDANEEADTAAGGEEVIPQQEETEILASSLMGAEVHLADESIGTVSDIIIGEDNMVKGVVVGVGGFLGIGEKRVALPMEKITIQPTEEAGEVELSTSNTREELEAFEEFKTASDVQAEEEAAQSQQQMDTQQPAAPTPPAAPQQ